ncbi:hypothetical protein LL266_16775 [Vibrio anguillarum]|uniref:hypothetical protein n=1 Tax=Vibrio anguillarum TaxID=55601 RepID=UPI001D193878|nr:hypothetical protein [Vibrio anguillarum]MCC4238145.1 hypothetical protein [Vibrio anguillarum]
MAMISKKEAHYQSGPKKGKLKPCYYYDQDGKLRKAQPVKRTKLYKAAAKLGSAGGKATARRQRKLF